MHCRDHAVQLHRARERFEQAGVGLVLIGQATPRQASAFSRKLDLAPIRVLADDERTTYRLAGLRRGSVGDLLGPKSLISGIRHGRRSGVVQGRIIGDAAQLGGAAVIDPQGRVTYFQANEHAGDTVEPDELLAAAEGAAA